MYASKTPTGRPEWVARGRRRCCSDQTDEKQICRLGQNRAGNQQACRDNAEYGLASPKVADRECVASERTDHRGGCRANDRVQDRVQGPAPEDAAVICRKVSPVVSALKPVGQTHIPGDGGGAPGGQR